MIKTIHSDGWLKVVCGDAVEALEATPGGSIQCIVTSPPYWNLRDYSACGCAVRLATARARRSDKEVAYSNLITKSADDKRVTLTTDPNCVHCGGTGKIEAVVAGQYGLEKTPELYLENMERVFQAARRVLRADGTLWLNIGDTWGEDKALIGIPWRLALALKSNGFILRSEIIWSKPNPMPESVTDRPTDSHEHVFLFAKSERYIYNAQAIAQPCISSPRERRKINGHDSADTKARGEDSNCGTNETRNKRSVWTIATAGSKEAHTAIFPEELAKLCILAGSRPAGKKCDCDALIQTPTGEEFLDVNLITGGAGTNNVRGENAGTRPITRREQRDHARQLKVHPMRELMEQECGSAFLHYIRTDYNGARAIPPILLEMWKDKGWIVPTPPCNCPVEPADVVLDIFGGSGTVGKVANDLGRRAVLFDINPRNAAICVGRCHVTPGLAL